MEELKALVMELIQENEYLKRMLFGRRGAANPGADRSIVHGGASGEFRGRVAGETAGLAAAILPSSPGSLAQGTGSVVTDRAPQKSAGQGDHLHAEELEGIEPVHRSPVPLD